VKGERYCYESSEFWIRRLINQLNHGAQFNALNWFKKVSTLTKKENETGFQPVREEVILNGY
jgi:hypothetical protein